VSGNLPHGRRRHFQTPRPLPTLLEEFGLAELSHRPFGGLSGGQKRRLAVALAFVGDPDLVLLDEPTTSLDVFGRPLWEAIRRAARAGTTVVLTSHYLQEVEV
jgi:ABC-2 type transport system ATP-binding protein